VFWDASACEFLAALDGWREANGCSDAEQAEPMTHDRLRELMARFPD